MTFRVFTKVTCCPLVPPKVLADDIRREHDLGGSNTKRFLVQGGTLPEVDCIAEGTMVSNRCCFGVRREVDKNNEL